MTARARARYASKEQVFQLAEAAQAAGIDTARCGIEFARDGTVRFVQPSPPSGDLFERFKDQL